LVNISHISSGGMPSAILAVPMLEDFSMICATVSGPWACESPMVAVPMVILPGAVSNMVRA
jgi:hypothetical protein